VMAPLLAQLQQGLLDGAGITELEERYVALLRDMLHQPSAALRSIVAYHVGELGLDGLREEVAEVCQGTTSTFRSVANRALELLDVAPPSSPLIGPELSGAS